MCVCVYGRARVLLTVQWRKGVGGSVGGGGFYSVRSDKAFKKNGKPKRPGLVYNRNIRPEVTLCGRQYVNIQDLTNNRGNSSLFCRKFTHLYHHPTRLLTHHHPLTPRPPPSHPFYSNSINSLAKSNNPRGLVCVHTNRESERGGGRERERERARFQWLVSSRAGATGFFSFSLFFFLRLNCRRFHSNFEPVSFFSCYLCYDRDMK